MWHKTVAISSVNGDLLDWNAEALLEAYRKRWQIERFHRFLKETVGLAHLYSFQEAGLFLLLHPGGDPGRCALAESGGAPGPDRDGSVAGDCSNAPPRGSRPSLASQYDPTTPQEEGRHSGRALFGGLKPLNDTAYLPMVRVLGAAVHSDHSPTACIKECRRSTEVGPPRWCGAIYRTNLRVDGG